MTSRTHRFEQVRRLHDRLELVVQRFEHGPSRWLPGPLDMTGAHEFAGHLRVLSIAFRYRYILEPEWVFDPTVSRHIELRPTGGATPTITGEITLAPSQPTGTELRFAGEWHQPRNLAARPFGPVLARTLISSFTNTVTGNLTAARPGVTGGT